MKLAPRGRKQKEHRRRDPELRKRYFTARWARLRQVVLARDNHLCQECSRRGKTNTGNEVDHIKKAANNKELFWATDNLQTLCHACHLAKTNRGE